MTELFAPPAYWRLKGHDKDGFCNGCGPGGWVGFAIPDRLWGLDIREACNIHDFMYAVGETIGDKDEADRVFLNNMLRLVDAGTRFWPVRALRARSAVHYYRAVRDLGGPIYWSGKNAPAQMGTV